MCDTLSLQAYELRHGKSRKWKEMMLSKTMLQNQISISINYYQCICDAHSRLLTEGSADFIAHLQKSLPVSKPVGR